MNQLNIHETKRTPEVFFDPNGTLRIKGRSIPEDASKFFDPLYKWLCEYAQATNTDTKLDVILEYFNSGSAKALLHMLKLVVNLRNDHKHTVIINWHFENGDDDILERGQYYSSILNFEFKYFEI